MCNTDIINFPRLVVGLGNPGSRYRKNRHNLGFRVVEAMAAKLGLAWDNSRKSFLATPWSGQDGELVLLQPQTYMNLSGEAVTAWLEQQAIEPVLERILVVCDDLALPLGALRLRGKGSSGGQNGLLSIIEHLGSENFPRLRLGIDGTEGRLLPEEWPDYVLADFENEELEMAEALVSQAQLAVQQWSDLGLERAASRFNGLVEP